MWYTHIINLQKREVFTIYKSIQHNNSPVNNISLTSGLVNEKLTPLHNHDFNEIVIILGGNAIQHINKQKYLVSAGDVFIMESVNSHQFSEANNLRLFNIGYKQEVFNAFESLVRKLPGYHALFILEPLYRIEDNFKSRLHLNTNDILDLSQILDLLSNEFKSKDPARELMITSCFLQIVGFLCRKYDDYRKIIKNEFIPSLSYIISYIESNYMDNIKLEVLAQMVNISVNSLINIFKKTFNTTPLNYILCLRIRKACEMMLHNNKSITQIAFDVGFCDSNYFSRFFKKILGITPSEYRKKYHQLNIQTTQSIMVTSFRTLV